MSEDKFQDFVPYEQSLVLRELGFDEPCFGFWSSKDNYRRFINDSSTNKDLVNMFGEEAKKAPTAPLYQQAFRWFREKYNIIHKISNVHHPYIDKIQYSYNLDDSLPKTLFNTYEEAELACLNKLIEIVKR